MAQKPAYGHRSGTKAFVCGKSQLQCSKHLRSPTTTPSHAAREVLAGGHHEDRPSCFVLARFVCTDLRTFEDKEASFRHRSGRIDGRNGPSKLGLLPEPLTSCSKFRKHTPLYRWVEEYLILDQHPVGGFKLHVHSWEIGKTNPMQKFWAWTKNHSPSQKRMWTKGCKSFT